MWLPSNLLPFIEIIPVLYCKPSQIIKKMSFESDTSEYECDFDSCMKRSNSIGLPFDPTSLENVILFICDQFDFRVILNDGRAKNALLVTTGLTIAGSMIGKHYGGKIGAAVGGAVGGVCGLGIVAVSMRDIWEDIKAKLYELLEIVYDYLAGLGLEDYKKAAKFLTQHSSDSSQLAMVIMQVTSDVLGKKILSTLSAGPA